MKLIKISSIVLAALAIAACSPSKKTTPSVAANPPAKAPAPAATTPVASGPELPPVLNARSKGIFAPGNDELVAIQAKYKDVTAQTLSEGYAIYTGACTNCHGAKSIYSRSEQMWPGIIDDMAARTKLSDAQKDAVYKYVLSIKATQPK